MCTGNDRPCLCDSWVFCGNREACRPHFGEPCAQRMEPQNPPSKIAYLADHDFLAISGARNSYGLEMKNEGSSNGGGGGGSSPTGLGLSLELGRGGGSSNRHGCSKSSGFTFLQLQELEHQALIYNYIEAGLSVPYHLLLPIWKSVAGSLTGLNHDLQQQYYPHFVGLSSMHRYYENSAEPEPGRCRRTDGKKWRCSKDVIPNHRYCERHIHRGRQRSRKRVEAPPQHTTTTARSNPTSSDVQLSNTNL